MTASISDSKHLGNIFHSLGWAVSAQRILYGEKIHNFGKVEDAERVTLVVLVELFLQAGLGTPEQEMARADAVFWGGLGAVGALTAMLAQTGCDVEKARAALILIYPDQSPT